MKNKNLIKLGVVFISSLTLLSGCGQSQVSPTLEDAATETQQAQQAEQTKDIAEDASDIVLADDGITIDGKAADGDEEKAVYIANDIIYYEDGKDFTYGAGSTQDAHSAQEAENHTVVHITEPGTYRISGTLSAGQIAIDLGEDAKENPQAVVTLILDNANVTCSVAPAVIFYNVYECGSTQEETASKDVDTTAAGANVIIADGSVNQICGSYVAKIYKSVELNDDKTEVVDSKKLHKYDGAFYSKMSMNVNGGTQGTGILNISADNEGLDSELHLTINGGIINITSGNDGINTNEDGISVTTINGGTLNIVVDGATGEGDGIDSNGWIVINGGTINAYACALSPDSGIDSDMGIYINGGTITASGNMLDEISESGQNYLVLGFSSTQKGNTTYTLKDDTDTVLAAYTPANDFTYLVVSSESLTEGTYSVWMGDTQLSGAVSTTGMAKPGMGGMEPPKDGMMPEGTEMPEGMEPPKDGMMPEGTEMPEGMEPPKDGGKAENMELPEGMERPEDGTMPAMPRGMEVSEEDLSDTFVIETGGNYYMGVYQQTQ